MVRSTQEAQIIPYSNPGAASGPGLQQPGTAGQEITPPLDFRPLFDFVPSRLTVHRRPPPLPLVLDPRVDEDMGGDEVPSEAKVSAIGRSPLVGQQQGVDFGIITGLQQEELALRVMDLSARLAAQPDVANLPQLKEGLHVLHLQAAMFQHLHIMRTASSEVSA